MTKVLLVLALLLPMSRILAAEGTDDNSANSSACQGGDCADRQPSADGTDTSNSNTGASSPVMLQSSPVETTPNTGN